MIERNRVVALRVARVVSAAGGMVPAVHAGDLGELRGLHRDRIDVLWCDAIDVEGALDAVDAGWVGAVGVWTAHDPRPLFELTLRDRRLAHVIGWPSFASMPRPWELTLATRRLLHPTEPSPRVTDLLSDGAAVVKYQPASSADRDTVVRDVEQWLERGQVPGRIAARAGEVIHELLMNALYDAPVDALGQPRFAADRRQTVTLSASEAPTLRVGTDGMLLVLQVSDPFGRLERHRLLGGILRGYATADGGGALDLRGGGAGLGLHRVYAAGVACVAEVRPGELTRITCALDLDTNPRDLRGQPGSLHLLGALAGSTSAASGGWT
ncbi:MAG: hypothetical protein ABMB14_16880 [Myxococcota bacterium]